MKEKCFFVYKNETIIAILCVVYRAMYSVTVSFFGAAHTNILETDQITAN